MFRAIHAGVPSCLASDVQYWQLPRMLHSGNTIVLHLPYTSLDFHQHFFEALAPMVWNNKPATIHDSVGLDTFKTAFNTHLITVLTHHAIDSDNLSTSNSPRDLWH